MDKLKNNIFKSTLDSVFYFILYLFLPIIQVIVLLLNNDKTVLLLLLLTIFGILYDSYTRYNHEKGKCAKLSIYTIGITAFVMLLVTITFIIFELYNFNVSSALYLLYLPIVAIFCIVLWYAIGIIKYEYKVKTGGVL